MPENPGIAAVPPPGYPRARRSTRRGICPTHREKPQRRGREVVELVASRPLADDGPGNGASLRLYAADLLVITSVSTCSTDSVICRVPSSDARRRLVSTTVPR